MTKITFISLLAGEGRGEEVDAVGVAPERLLLGRERLRGSRYRRLRRGGAVLAAGSLLRRPFSAQQEDAADRA